MEPWLCEICRSLVLNRLKINDSNRWPLWIGFRNLHTMMMTTSWFEPYYWWNLRMKKWLRFSERLANFSLFYSQNLIQMNIVCTLLKPVSFHLSSAKKIRLPSFNKITMMIFVYWNSRFIRWSRIFVWLLLWGSCDSKTTSLTVLKRRSMLTLQFRSMIAVNEGKWRFAF